MEQYLVDIPEADFGKRIVNARDRDDAIIIYLRHSIPSDTYFMEYVSSKVINASFAEYFWYDDPKDGYDPDDEPDEPVSKNEFLQRITDGFPADTDYAERYKDYYFSDRTEPDFPIDMFVYIFLKTKHSPVEVVRMVDIPVI